MKVLISNLYECAVNDIIIYKTSPQKVIFIATQDKNTKSAISHLQKKFQNINFEVIYVDEFDIVGITKKIDAAIKKEKGNQISVNVTEGRKTMSLAGVFAAGLNKEYIEGVFYLRQDNHELMQIPLPNFKLSGNKLKILSELDNGIRKVKDIQKRVKVHRSLIYATLIELEKEGYINSEKIVTDTGKIYLIAKKN